MIENLKLVVVIAGAAVLFVAIVLFGGSIENSIKQSNIDECVAVAQADYSANWDAECVSEGKQPDCELPFAMAESFRDQREKAGTFCVSRY